MEYSKFVVDETPHCMWGRDLRDLNLTTIESIDPEYFKHKAEMYRDLLEGEKRRVAALELRIAYSHGLETLFALLCAAIQAPDCVNGWLLRYKPFQLQNLISKIKSRRPILSKHKIDFISWKQMSMVIHHFLKMENHEMEERTKKLFGNLWSLLGNDFIDENKIIEYNSIKHGFRVWVGGFSISIGEEEITNTEAVPEMQTLNGSEHGSTFFVSKPIRKDKVNFSISRYSFNWNPENFVYGLFLISMSINNIISFLKCVNGVDPSTVIYKWPKDEEHFFAPWKGSSTPIAFSSFPIFKEFEIPLFSKDEIISEYFKDNRYDKK